ncbi:MAG: hypothetical protein HRT54_00485 [Colwellia sp.]|nr:hypothetical protein [Colwellia sp.]
MKLFSWFIKTDKRSKTQQESLKKSVIKELENTLDDELNTFNNNTMWPIAKVKTTTMIIKKPEKKDKQDLNDKITKPSNKAVDLSLVTIPLAHQ